MTWTWTTALAAGALCSVVALGDAPAQAAAHSVAAARLAKTAKPTAKQPPKSLRTIKVIVTNSRPATLVELQASVSGSAKMKRVLGFLKPGKQAVAIMPRGEDCEVDLHGAFDDGQTMDSTGVDVCADKTFNLTD
jgi:hypothetical protein